ncbi:hypothetical protein Xhom_01854 [Xenorhabdus hominickii]|uniref:Uncharacterized protein n=1 Tax=Xenorhabdus hominickii TaxID=351679 RepID=A0A2G0QAX7_XENHO|nr:hypothetical protein Xhom_01854 [Xenorhabdus hominickii]
MKNVICIYRNLKFDGNIYVKINDRLTISNSKITLFKNGKIIGKKNGHVLNS